MMNSPNFKGEIMWTQQKTGLLYFNELSCNFEETGGHSFLSLKKGVENTTFWVFILRVK